MVYSCIFIEAYYYYYFNVSLRGEAQILEAKDLFKRHRYLFNRHFLCGLFLR